MSRDNAKTPKERQERIEGILSSTISDLSPLERGFVVHYLSQAKPNATKAYLDAGGTAKHPDRSAYQIRHRLRVQEAIDAYFRSQEMSAQEVVARLTEQADGPYGEYGRINPQTGDLEVDVKELIADGKGHLIKGVNYVKIGEDNYKQVVEFYDGQRATIKIGEYQAIFTKNVEHTITVTPDQAKQTAMDKLAKIREANEGK